jgi:uncharacterized protein (TIGR03083 family)
MESTTYIDAIRRESAALVTAAEHAGLDRPVPSCPEWTLADLMRHIGIVQRWATNIVELGLDADIRRSDIETPTDPHDLAAWVLDGSEALATALERTPPDAKVWTFSGEGEASFWPRRQAHEVAMHRVDAELASGAPSPIDAELARDGIDEFFDVIAPFRLADRLTGAGETLHFHRTDGDGEWLVRLAPDGPEIERTHAKGDVAVRGSASDLLLVMRNRIGLDTVEVFGDASLIERWHDLASI